ncbi:MAG: hypothetical protein JWN55_1778 [Frankiales bacterium]|nr:hypothetical protein [Frankiales bacterium]
MNLPMRWKLLSDLLVLLAVVLLVVALVKAVQALLFAAAAALVLGVLFTVAKRRAEKAARRP